MKLFQRHHAVIILVSSMALFSLGMIWQGVRREMQRHEVLSAPVGTEIDSLNGVVVYANGTDANISHGKHHSKDGYYYGHQWQCVEFVKRYYYDHYQHKMPNGWGHARSFYDPSVKDGHLNQPRGLLQFQNGGRSKPEVGDLLVYVFGKYGHVAIVSKVTNDSVEVVQQNVHGLPRDRFPLSNSEGLWTIGHDKIAGWLRMQQVPQS